MPEDHNERHYLMRLEFLGFRYHGWQEQPGERTVSGMLRKTFRFVLPGVRVKLLGAGRTDARVSARDFAVQVITICTDLSEPGILTDIRLFTDSLNANLPPDIRVTALSAVGRGFNPIRDCENKTYHYYFRSGNRPDPYMAACVGFLQGPLDTGSVREAAPLFEGTHNFRCFTASPAPGKKYERHIYNCRIGTGNPLMNAGSGEDIDRLEVSGPGFGRNQVRLMMTALAAVGRGELSPESIKKTLRSGAGWQSKRIVPASGLHLMQTVFKQGTT